MIFNRRTFIFIGIFCFLCQAYADQRNSYAVGSKGETALLRPILLRSEFVDSKTLQKLRDYSML